MDYLVKEGLIHQAIIAQLPSINIPKKENLPTWANGTNILIALGIFGIVLMNIAPDQKANKLANSEWGTSAEIAMARKKAKKQIANPTRNSVSLYINLDPDVRKKRDANWEKMGWKNPVKVTPAKREKGEPKPKSDRDIATFYIPDAQRGIFIGGSAGSGKTFSAADPLARSAVDQGFPIALYDFKYPEQSSRLAAYAVARGYQVDILAPGYPESCTCNPTEFIRDEEDSIAAGQLGKTINANINIDDSKKDEFFESAGNAFIEGALLLTKAVPKLLVKLDAQRFGDESGKPNELAKSFDDLMTTQAIIALPDVANRLAQAKEAGIISAWTGIPFNQAISVKDAEKTIAGIVSTALAVFRNFIKKDFVAAFIGKSDLPERIEGKRLVIFGLDNINREVVSPVLASTMHMFLRNNIYGKVKRKDPLITLLDEVATIRLPSLVNLLAEGREMGFCGILGVQHLPQLEKTYGKEVARTIFGNCATKIIFNPQELESAKTFSEMLGETEITTKSSSTSRSRAKSGGSSTSGTNTQQQKKHLFEPAQIMRMKTGRCIILNPNFERGEEAYMPILKTMEIRQEEIAHQVWSTANWDSVVKSVMSKRKNQQLNNTDADEAMRQMLIDRDELAKIILPLQTAEAA
jgi:type IV secretory pathway TraG/TraD family ATPase VirD4